MVPKKISSEKENNESIYDYLLHDRYYDDYCGSFCMWVSIRCGQHRAEVL